MIRKDLAFTATFLLLLLGIAVQMILIPKMNKKFSALEAEHLELSNQLATSQVLETNMKHVKELVRSNVVQDSIPSQHFEETQMFVFITRCVNDLKMELVSIEPLKSKTQGRILRNSYRIIVKGNYFNFGELISKFENSRRIIRIDSYEATLDNEKGSASSDLRVIMKISTFKVLP